MNQTPRALSQITDAGLFEQLATAVLRSARPELYGSLTHPGINERGQPVKSPVDGIAFVPGSISPRHLVAAHHTICRRDELRRKWLHDPGRPGTVTGSGASLGDIIKTIRIVTEERVRDPALRVTLALTTNEEPSEDLTRDAYDLASRSGISLDLWSRARIADYLDNEPNGQWLRRRFLEVEQERLSHALLQHLSRQSIAIHAPPVERNLFVERDVLGVLAHGFARPLGFLVGQSGFGKSVASYQFIAAHVDSGGCGIVLPHECLENALTIERAIEKALRQLHPQLSSGSGAEALALCTVGNPLLIVIEDVNRSNQPAALIESLIRWGSVGDDSIAKLHSWRIICPIWPQLIALLGQESRKRFDSLSVTLGPFTAAEARTSVERRALHSGIDLSTPQADEIATALGCDPLLIALHDLVESSSQNNVIEQFIVRSSEQLAQTLGSFTSPDYLTALRKLADAMLKYRNYSPGWEQMNHWFYETPQLLATLRDLTKQAKILHLTGSGLASQIGFRHDRVRMWLLVDAAVAALCHDYMPAAIFYDPYFSEIIGLALADDRVPIECVDQAVHHSPLALFFALKSFAEPSAEIHHAILKAIDTWLAIPTSLGRQNQSLLWTVTRVLGETQSSYVIPIVARLKARNDAALVACFRNGDLNAGLQLCRLIEPGIGSDWRDMGIQHGKRFHGAQFFKQLKTMLRDPELGESQLVGALRLSGHLADSTLADAIGDCWAANRNRLAHLAAYLWAAAQCGGNRTQKLLEPMCQAWAALPDKETSNGRSLRNSLATDCLSSAFWRSIPSAAISYFIQRARQDDLRWPITYMLHGVDHPDAMEFVAREVATLERSLQGKNGFSPFAMTVRDVWTRNQQERGVGMSRASRDRLQQLWESDANDTYLRRNALKLWTATKAPGDVDVLKNSMTSDAGNDVALQARLERGDTSAIAILRDRLLCEGNGYHWWHWARYVWSDLLTQTLDEMFAKRRDIAEIGWFPAYPSDGITAQVLLRLPHTTAESLLAKHWDHLRFSPEFIQSALYISSPKMRGGVTSAVSDCPEAGKLFEHIDSHFGVRTSGHPGVTRLTQLEGLIPYLDWLDATVIYNFWSICNERGWIQFRKVYLDSRLGTWRNNVSLTADDIVSMLDNELVDPHPYWMEHWVGYRLKDGLTLKEILAGTEQWLTLHKGPIALELAAQMLEHVGSRADVDILLAGDDKSDTSADIIADTRFAVAQRTLV